MRLLSDERGALNRQEAYQMALKLHREQNTQLKIKSKINQFLPQISQSTISRWITGECKPWPSPNLSPSSHLAYILGVILGDGYVMITRHRHVMGLLAKDKEFIDAFCNKLRNIGLIPCKICLVKASGGRSGEDKYFHVQTGSKEFVRWFQRLSLEEIGQLVVMHEMDFIRGFYDSEGCLQPRLESKSFRIDIKNTDLSLISMVQRMMLKLGFKTSIYKINREGIEGMGNRKDIYNLYLCGGGSEIIRFLKLIQPSIPRKSIKRTEGLR